MPPVLTNAHGALSCEAAVEVFAALAVGLFVERVAEPEHRVAHAAQGGRRGIEGLDERQRRIGRIAFAVRGADDHHKALRNKTGRVEILQVEDLDVVVGLAQLRAEILGDQL